MRTSPFACRLLFDDTDAEPFAFRFDFGEFGFCATQLRPVKLDRPLMRGDLRTQLSSTRLYICHLTTTDRRAAPSTGRTARIRSRPADRQARSIRARAPRVHPSGRRLPGFPFARLAVPRIGAPNFRRMAKARARARPPY